MYIASLPLKASHGHYLVKISQRHVKEPVNSPVTTCLHVSTTGGRRADQTIGFR